MSYAPLIVFLVYCGWMSLGGWNTARALMSIVLFWFVWFMRMCFEWTDQVPADHFYDVRNQRLISTLVIAILPFLIPRILRGARQIWAELRVFPPFSWWVTLPMGCGWGVLMTGFALAGRWWMDPAWGWVEVAVFLVYVWGSIGILHACRAASRWWDRRGSKDAPFLEGA